MIDTSQGDCSPTGGSRLFPKKKKKKSECGKYVQRKFTTKFGLPRFVPYYLHREFRDAEWMLKIVHDLAMLQGELKRLRPAAASVLLDHAKIDECFETIRRELVSHTPFQICRACPKDETICPKCQGRFWIPAVAASQEKVEKRLNHYPLGFPPPQPEPSPTDP